MAWIPAAVVTFYLVVSLDCKVYDQCEFARELRDVHRIPEKYLPTWVCIAKHESHFNTSAMNMRSGDHGIFQISELFWCSPPGYACGVPCDQLRDEDIEDDVICAKRIHREHTLISGDGFTAWVVYNLHCRNHNYVKSLLNGCFDEDNLIDDQERDYKQQKVQTEVATTMDTEFFTQLPPSTDSESFERFNTINDINPFYFHETHLVDTQNDSLGYTITESPATTFNTYNFPHQTLTEPAFEPTTNFVPVVTTGYYKPQVSSTTSYAITTESTLPSISTKNYLYLNKFVPDSTYYQKHSTSTTKHLYTKPKFETIQESITNKPIIAPISTKSMQNTRFQFTTTQNPVFNTNQRQDTGNPTGFTASPSSTDNYYKSTSIKASRISSIFNITKITTQITTAPTTVPNTKKIGVYDSSPFTKKSMILPLTTFSFGSSSTYNKVLTTQKPQISTRRSEFSTSSLNHTSESALLKSKSTLHNFGLPSTKSYEKFTTSSTSVTSRKPTLKPYSKTTPTKSTFSSGNFITARTKPFSPSFLTTPTRRIISKNTIEALRKQGTTAVPSFARFRSMHSIFSDPNRFKPAFQIGQYSFRRSPYGFQLIRTE